MNQNSKISAYEIINTYTKEQLTSIFKDYGELHDAHFIAEKILPRKK